MAESDFIVMAPGDLYTSSIPNLLVRGVPEALHRPAAKLVFVLNLMTKRGETLGYPASRHIEEIIHYGGPCARRGPGSPRETCPRTWLSATWPRRPDPVDIDESTLRALGVPVIWTAR